jgi:hypothetical protein
MAELRCARTHRWYGKYKVVLEVIFLARSLCHPLGVSTPYEHDRARVRVFAIPYKGDNMTDETYEAPTIGVIGSVEELTQTVAKHVTNTPDGFSLNGTILTS